MSTLSADRPSYHRSSRSEQPVRSTYDTTDEPSTFETDPFNDGPSTTHETGNLLSASPSATSASIRRSRQESISSYLSSIDLQYPALVSLRDALLGYLGEAEDIVLERIRGRDGEAEQVHDDDMNWARYGPHLDAVMDSDTTGSTMTASTSASTSTSTTSSASSNLRNRTHLLRRRLSNTLPALPTRHIPSPEALLAHLSAIREDVVASLPAIPRRLGNLGLPSLPSRASLVALGDVSGLLQGLPQRLGVLNEHLPGLVVYPYTQGLGAASDWDGLDDAGNVDLGDDRALSPPPTTPDGLASRLSAENRKRIMGVVKSLLPSEDWPGWERLGWEDYDEDEDEEEFGSTRSGTGLGLGFRGPASTSRPGGMLGMRRSQSYKQPSTAGTDEMEWQSSARRQTNSSGSSPTSIIKRLLIHPSRSEPHNLHPNTPNLEVEEEPEYLFPNKTPAAAMRRQQSYAVKREARELRRARSVSLSALGEKGVEALSDGMEVRRVKSRDERGRSTVDLVFSDTEDEGRTGRTHVDDLTKDSENGEMDDENEDEMDVELDGVPVLDIGPTVHTALAKSENGTKLIVFDDIPWWMRNNEYVISGYRFIPLDAKTGPLRLIASAFRWHNETINIHSHFIPSVLLAAVFIPYTLFNPPFADPAPLDILTLLAFLASASACLISSASWHTLAGCARKRVFEWGACVDYVGISWLISCSIHTVYYNGFYCQGRTLLIYTLTTLGAAIAGSIAPFQPSFNERKNKNWRIAFFLAICLTALAPVTHLAVQHGISRSLRFAAPIAPSCAAYIFGLCFYATHFPESRFPGRFDTFGHSHQIWHLSILFGIYWHYTGSLTIFESRHGMACALTATSAGGTGAPMSSYLRGWGEFLLPKGMYHPGQAGGGAYRVG